MGYREVDPGDPDALEMMRGTNVVFDALQASGVDCHLLPSIFVRSLLIDLKTRKGTPLCEKLARIDEMAAYMRATVSADQMVEEFFGSER